MGGRAGSLLGGLLALAPQESRLLSYRTRPSSAVCGLATESRGRATVRQSRCPPSGARRRLPAGAGRRARNPGRTHSSAFTLDDAQVLLNRLEIQSSRAEDSRRVLRDVRSACRHLVELLVGHQPHEKLEKARLPAMRDGTLIWLRRHRSSSRSEDGTTSCMSRHFCWRQSPALEPHSRRASAYAC